MNNKKHNFWKGVWEFTLKDKFGNVKDQWKERNALADEGEQQMLDVFFRGATQPTTFYVRLYNDTPIETDSLSDLTGEPSTNGYSAQSLSADNIGFPTLELDSGDYQVVTAVSKFTASGGSIGPVTHAVLATSSDNTGKLIAFVELSQSRTLNDDESLDITITGKLQ